MKKPSAVRFFYNHAGWSYNPNTETKSQGRWRSARALTAAEKGAKAKGLKFHWEYDQDGCSGCECGYKDCRCANGTCQPEVCIVYSPEDKQLASLSGICGVTSDYGRVIEAELAQEALEGLQALEDEATLPATIA